MKRIATFVLVSIALSLVATFIATTGARLVRESQGCTDEPGGEEVKA